MCPNFKAAVVALLVFASLVPKFLFASTHPVGTNVISNGIVYFVDSGTKRPYTSAGAFLSYNFHSFNNLAQASAEDLALPTGSFVSPRDGSLINDHGTVYVITEGKRAGFASSNIFLGLGYSFGNVFPGDTSFLETLPAISSMATSHPAGTLVNDNGTIYVTGINNKIGIPSAQVFYSWGMNFKEAVPANQFDKASLQAAQETLVARPTNELNVFEFLHDSNQPISQPAPQIPNKPVAVGNSNGGGSNGFLAGGGGGTSGGDSPAGPAGGNGTTGNGGIADGGGSGGGGDSGSNPEPQPQPTPPPPPPPPPPDPQPTPSPTPDTSNANEPAGMTTLTDRAFNSLAQTTSDTAGSEGWDPHESQGLNVSIVQDATAPKSAPNVLQFFYPAGTTGGSDAATPGNVRLDFTSSQYVYVSTWVKWSQNFQGNGTSTNRVFYLWLNGQPEFFMSAEGADNGDLEPTGRLQDTMDQRDKLPPNLVSSEPIQRGQWQHWEILVKANTPGQNDGEFHLWVNGQKVSEYKDVGYLDSGQTDNFTTVAITPIWGGLGSTVAADQYIWFDHMYISTK